MVKRFLSLPRRGKQVISIAAGVLLLVIPVFVRLGLYRAVIGFMDITDIINKYHNQHIGELDSSRV